MNSKGTGDEITGGGGPLHVVATKKVSRGRYRIVARQGDLPVHSDIFDPSEARRRGEFIEATVAALNRGAASMGVAISPAHLAIVRGSMDAQLLKLADDLEIEDAQAPTRDQGDSFSNAGGDGLGRMIDELAADLIARTGGWPKRVGSALFAESEEGTPVFLDSPTELFAWVRAQFPVVWQRGPDKVPQEEFYAHLRRTAEGYDAIEQVPHWPPRPGTYYMTPDVPPGDGTHLDDLLGVLNPATAVDRELIKAYLMTLVWGGAPGTRPTFVITGPEADEHQGRGVGKSTLVAVMAPLFGGLLMATPNGDLAAIVKRLLSPEGRGKRVMLLDNLKTHRFSWGDLEGLITSPVISGHEMYKGEGQRPNTVTVAITVNGPSLSKDMARRSIIIRLARPEYLAEWAETVRDFVRDYRWQILGDLRRLLEEPMLVTYAEHSQWTDWEAQVLAKVEDPSTCQAVVLQRQRAVDDDAGEAEFVAEQFRSELARRDHDPDGSYVLIPTKLAVEWLELALGERFRTTRARAVLNGLGIPELRESAKNGKRGWSWTGKGANTNVGMALVEKYCEDFQSIQWQGAFAPAAPSAPGGTHEGGHVPD